LYVAARLSLHHIRMPAGPSAELVCYDGNQVCADTRMDDIYARRSKSGEVLCGQAGADGRFTCDAPLAEVIRPHRERGMPERRLAALDGWIQGPKGVWQQTTRTADLRRRGIAPTHLPPEKRTLIEFPALARCPKCRAVQWLDAARLGVSPGVEGGRRPASRWVVWE
jgi:hypothetical protein